MTPTANHTSNHHASRTTAEETASAAVQAFGATASIIGLIFLIVLAIPHGALPVTSVAIYGTALVLAFLASALYHGVPHPRAKMIFRTVDHCTIYVLIAGTYTPVALLVLRGYSAWTLVALAWLLAGTGVALRILCPRRLVKIRIGLYLALGWMVLVWAKPVFDSLGFPGTAFLLAGGLAYSLGVIFYAWKGLPFNQTVWHLFVVAGSACFFVAIAFHALPAHSV